MFCSIQLIRTVQVNYSALNTMELVDGASGSKFGSFDQIEIDKHSDIIFGENI